MRNLPFSLVVLKIFRIRIIKICACAKSIDSKVADSATEVQHKPTEALKSEEKVVGVNFWKYHVYSWLEEIACFVQKIVHVLIKIANDKWQFKGFNAASASVGKQVEHNQLNKVYVGALVYLFEESKYNLPYSIFAYFMFVCFFPPRL